MVYGRALDRNGNVIPGATVTLLDGECRSVGSTVTNVNGEFSFNHVNMEQSQEIFKIRAALSGGHWTSETAFFYVTAMLQSSQDVRFYDYPSSGVGGLYGIVTSDNTYYVEVPATVYLDNGMFILYSGNRYDQWSFDQLPQGRYVLWAERNINGVTYTSERYTVTVPTDEKAYQRIFVPITDPVAYHQQPVPLKNVVHGTVIQKNGALLPDARVDLYRCSGSNMELVASACSNINGQYQFNNVYTSMPSEQFLVRVTYEANGEQQTQDSDKFTVYYANTLNVPHDYNVPVAVPYVTTSMVTICSVPSGAQINIDGVDTGRVTPCDISLKTGEHLLGLYMEDYFCDNTTLQVPPETAMTVNRTLRLSTGNLSMDVNPINAKIFFDGQYIGSGPLTLAKKPAGVYDYVLVCAGYQNESGTVSILPGESVTREINMVASPGISLTYIAYLISSIIESISHIF